MELYVVNGETLTDMANAIRGVTGDNKLYTPAEMVRAIETFDGMVSTVEPAEDDIPMVFFGGNLPQTKDESIISFRYISKTKDISGYCKTKAQGSSSMNYPKKNQTVKLYKDAACTEKLNVNFKGWGDQNKFCFKANWIDLTHARNIVSARIWSDIVKSRANYDDMPEVFRNSPNQGAIDGFPVKVYANGIYQGRYTLNIPKDAWTFNMNDELDEHCVLCGESNADGRSLFRTAPDIDGIDWTDEIHDTVPATIKTRWNEVINFVMNSADVDFKANLSQYFYVDSLIDYYVFGLVSCGLDGYGKNQIYATYDGQRWVASMYDMDSTWGLWWDGSCYVGSDYTRNEYQDFKDGEGNLLYIRLESLFVDEIKARWEELKYGVLSKANIIARFERFTNIAPAELVKEDYANTTANGAFTNIPAQTTNTVAQIRNYAAARWSWCDMFVESLGQEETSLVYSLTDSTYDGTNYTDTGVQLRDYENYTVLFDFTINDYVYSSDNRDVYLSNTTDEGSGWFIRKISAMWEPEYCGYTGDPTTYGLSNETSETSSKRRHKIAITKASNSVLTMYSEKYPNGVDVSATVGANMDAQNGTLLIGATNKWSTEICWHSKSTVHTCEIHSEVLSASRIEEFMNG